MWSYSFNETIKRLQRGKNKIIYRQVRLKHWKEMC